MSGGGAAIGALLPWWWGWCLYIYAVLPWLVEALGRGVVGFVVGSVMWVFWLAGEVGR